MLQGHSWHQTVHGEQAGMACRRPSTRGLNGCFAKIVKHRRVAVHSRKEVEDVDAMSNDACPVCMLSEGEYAFTLRVKDKHCSCSFSHVSLLWLGTLASLMLGWGETVKKTHLEERLLDQAQARASYTPLFWGHSRSIPQGMILDVQPLVKSLFCPIRASPNGFFDFEASTP